MNAITADWVLTPDDIETGKVILYEDSGKIVKVVPEEEVDTANLRRVEGILCPGFVNAHCHLELSHLKGRIPKGTGMVGFIQHLQSIRQEASEAAQQEAMIEAARSMWDSGIVAVGDICNGPESLAAKEVVSEIHWHNFIEVFGLRSEAAESTLERARKLRAQFGEERSTITLHAPYSISTALKKQVYEEALTQSGPLSVHLMESKEEMELFEHQSGPFLDFFKAIGVTYPHGTYTHPLDFLADGLPTAALSSMIWVHNTEMKKRDITKAQGFSGNNFWYCLCPRANAYIHGTAPDLKEWKNSVPGIVCLGTDSLAGNDSLDLLEEIRLIQELEPAVPLGLALAWASTCGAIALGIHKRYGSFAPGKKPGILQVSPVSKELKLTPESSVKRII